VGWGVSTAGAGRGDRWQIESVSEREGESESDESPGEEGQPKIFDREKFEEIGKEDWLAVYGV
jgi:hypothetical protein